ncbi:MAG: molybdenum cofactor guanylyltransferase [Fidelibacterota bacterium]|jgi:molybdopterin-guanine dinucleotide biosynthesis protein A
MNQSTKISATATILIGGHSKRFGSPKWEATVNGIRLIDRTWDLCGMFDNRFVIGKEKPNLMPYPFIRDELDIQSPINGLYSALNHSISDWNFIISCDLPLMTHDIIYKLWELTNKKYDAIIPVVSGYSQATCAFYHKRVSSQIPRQIENSNLSIHGLLETLKAKKVKLKNTEKEFTNMNTREELEKI